MMNKITSRRDIAPTPLQFGGDVVAWAAWLYYEEELTQNEVASAMNLSRASVANYLAEARSRGLVSIAMNPEHLARMQIGTALADQFGLSAVYLLPVTEDEGALVRRLGKAGARILIDRLSPDDVLGIAWGRTVYALAEALPMAHKMPGLQVVQIAGSSIGGGEYSPELCTSTIAHRLGANCINLHAPAYLSSAQIHDALMREPALVHQFNLIRSCTRVVFGIGNLTPETRFAGVGFIPATTARDYLHLGAVCVTLGRFLDASGNESSGPLSDRIVAMTFGDLLTIPERLCVAGGLAKLRGIRSVLLGGYATHLITDMQTASALLYGVDA